MSKNRDKKKVLISTALQDHLTKNLGLINVYSSNQIKSTRPIKPISKEKVRPTAKIPEKEYVIIEKDKKVSLAEKMGIIKSEYDMLNENDWVKVKEKCNKREELKNPCVICKEELGTENQVLLSCSHIFHLRCLQSFEKFSGKHSCPMCRYTKYRKRVVFDATLHYKHKCATKIQAAWKGYKIRQWYLDYRKSNPPKDKVLREKYFQDKLKQITDKLVNFENPGIENLISDVNENLAISRTIFDQLSLRLKQIDGSEWDNIEKTMCNRDNRECSICMMELNIKSLNSIDQAVTSKSDNCAAESIYPKNKPLVLLSCTHVFHQCCIEMFEELNFDQLHSCPVCRSLYKKKIL